MFCSNCGDELAADAVLCPACRHPVDRGGASTLAAVSREEFGRGSRDARQFITRLVRNPGGGVADGAKAIEGHRAFISGVLLSLVIALCVAIGATRATSSLLGARLGHVAFWKLVLVGLFPTVALGAVRTGMRRLFGKGGNFGQDLLGSAGVLIPFALAALIGRLVGIGNFEVVLILLVAAGVFLVIGLYETARSVAGIDERAAPIVITVEILIAAWLVKVLGVALW